MLDLLYIGCKVLWEKWREKAAQEKIEQEFIELSKLDTWTGIEKQLKQHQEFYNSPYLWWKFGVYWNGDTSKFLQICMGTVQVNKEFQKSGLSVEDFCRVHYTKLFQEHPISDPYWSSDFMEWERDIKLYEDYDKVIKVYPGLNNSFVINKNGERIEIKL